MAKKRIPDLQLLDVDDLCLAALGEYFRCDREANHDGSCGHSHTDENLCKWLDSFSEELTKKHRSVKVFGFQPKEVEHFPHGMYY